jgi:serine/threonine protein kinase
LPSFKSDEDPAWSSEPIDNKLIRVQGFCISSGFTKKKYSANSISQLYFMSPERILGKLNENNLMDLGKADIFSIGAILYTIVLGKTPFDGSTNGALVKTLKKGKLLDLKGMIKRFPKDKPSTKLLLQLILEMLSPDPFNRIDVAAAINHDFFTKSQNLPDFKNSDYSQGINQIERMNKIWN